jgi:uncharacterized protein YdhG (YjbR/CyaY superfamily)
VGLGIAKLTDLEALASLIHDDRQEQSPRPRVASVADYPAIQPSRSRVVLLRIRALVRNLVPEAVQRISYQLPAFKRGRVFVYFAAFATHVGIYPPVRGNPTLIRALAKYRNEKGNLRFPLDKPIPYGTIERVIKALAKQYSKETL